MAEAELGKLGPMKLTEKITIGVLLGMLCLWAGVPEWLLGKAYAVNPTTTAILGLAILLLTGVLDGRTSSRPRAPGTR